MKKQHQKKDAKEKFAEKEAKGEVMAFT